MRRHSPSPRSRPAAPAPRPTRSPFAPLIGLAALATALLAAPAAYAERAMDPSFEITALGGVGFGGKIDAEDVGGAPFQAQIQAGPLFDAMIGFRPYSDEGRLIIVSYQRQFTQVRVKPESGGSVDLDLDIGYLHAGGEIDGRATKWIHPFFGLTIGATHYSSKQPGAKTTSWFFSGGAHGGIKVPFGDHFGLRFQGRYLGTVLNADKQLFCQTSNGASCVLTLDDVSGVHQGEFSGGIFVSF